MATSKTLSKVVADQVEKQIICGNWPVGSQIPTEQELMTKFNISRITVREAIKSLVSKGILEIHRGKGTFVSVMPGLSDDPLGLKFVNDEDINTHLFEARQVFEPAVNRLAALRADEDEIVLLGQLADRMDELDTQLRGEDTSSEVILALSAKDIAFHTLLCKMSKNPVFERVLPIIIKSVYASYNMFIPRISNSPRVSTHHKIYQAIKDRDPDAAFDLTVQHLVNSKAGFEEAQKRGAR